MIKDLALSYFQAFSEKDIDALRAIYSVDVRLIDWELVANGLDAVLAANAKIFRMVNSISVVVTNIFICDHVAIAELNLAIDGDDAIRIVDILEFDPLNKICSIRAYKG
jgi:ketosteroid isomerase-like protein